MISPPKINALLKAKSNGLLFRRESSTLEFKESFSISLLNKCFRDFAAFANNLGGYIIFGVKDSPRKLVGLSEKSLKDFDDIDSAVITENLLGAFSPKIDLEQSIIEIDGKKVGVFYIHKCINKPVIAKTNNDTIKAADIYFRYGGRTQRIQPAELNQIIQDRIGEQKKDFLDMISKIAKIGPENTAILNTAEGVIEKNNQKFIIDKNLIGDINFIKEGHFTKTEGAPAFKIVGSVIPVNQVIAASRLDIYPFSFMEAVAEVKKQCPKSSSNSVSKIIKAHKIKNNPDYSSYSYRSKSQEKKHKETGVLLSVPSIYNMNAVKFIVSVSNKQGNL